MTHVQLHEARTHLDRVRPQVALVPLDEVPLLAVAVPPLRGRPDDGRLVREQERLERREARVHVGHDRQGPGAGGEVRTQQRFGVVRSERRDVVLRALLAVEAARHGPRQRWLAGEREGSERMWGRSSRVEG